MTTKPQANNPPAQERKTRDQIQAEDAWKEVAKYTGDMKELATTCKKTCSRVLTSGLAPALAFAGTKTDEPHKAVREALAKHFKLATAEALLEALIKGNAETLRRRTDEAMSFLVWMARLADGKAKAAGNNQKTEKARGG